jgi:uncharacterized protein with HEPN domain
MLREKRNDLFHLLNLLEAIGKIKKYIEGIDSADDFVNDKDQLIYNATHYCPKQIFHLAA